MTNREELFSQLLESCEPFIKATAFRFERELKSIPENYASVKASAVVYDKDDFENCLRMCLYRLMNTALETFEDKSMTNIARTFTTSGVAVKELCRMVSPHKDEQFSFSMDDSESYVQIPDPRNEVEEAEFGIAMGEATSEKPDARALYDLIVNQPEDFIQWCERRAESNQRNRTRSGIPNDYMKKYLKETRGWSYYRFDAAMKFLREKAKEVTAV